MHVVLVDYIDLKQARVVKRGLAVVSGDDGQIVGGFDFSVERFAGENAGRRVDVKFAIIVPA